MQMAATVTGSASYITLVCSDTGNGDGDVIDAASQIQWLKWSEYREKLSQVDNETKPTPHC